MSDAHAAGVTLVTSAGNEGEDVSLVGKLPQNHDDAITVSAIADFDGQPGGLADSVVFCSGPFCLTQADDAFAFLSNFGPKVDIAPPPAWRSTRPTRAAGYTTKSGTSMSSPHVAGAAALYIASHPRASPDDVKAGLLAAGFAQHGGSGFTGDPDHDTTPSSLDEPLVNAGSL